MSRLRLYSRLNARFDDGDEDPRASLVNLVDVMLVFACGLIAAIAGTIRNAIPIIDRPGWTGAAASNGMAGRSTMTVDSGEYVPAPISKPTPLM